MIRPRLLAEMTAVCFAATALAPAPAEAHVTPGLISTSFQARIDGIVPPADGVTARVLDGDQKLQLTVERGYVVVVRGAVGEPMLRLAGGAVYASTRSPTAASAQLVTAAQAGEPARWVRIGTGDTFAWHGIGSSLPDPSRSGPVARWRVPLAIDGRQAAVTGREWYASPPSRRPWALAVLAPVAVAAMLLALRRPRLAATVGVAAAVLAVAAWGLGWVGVVLYQRLTPGWIAIALLYAVSISMLLAAAVVEPRSAQARALVLGLLGLVVAAFSLPELGVFERGYVFSAWPASAARLFTAAGLGLGAAVAMLAILPALRADGRRRQVAGRRPSTDQR